MEQHEPGNEMDLTVYRMEWAKTDLQSAKLEFAKRKGRTKYRMKKYQCPCCGYFTYNVPTDEDCGYICPVCFWENDPFIASDNEPSDSNHGITLKEAKSNFLQFGACDKEMLCHVRPPRDDEKEIP